MSSIFDDIAVIANDSIFTVFGEDATLYRKTAPSTAVSMTLAVEDSLMEEEDAGKVGLSALADLVTYPMTAGDQIYITSLGRRYVFVQADYADGGLSRIHLKRIVT